MNYITGLISIIIIVGLYQLIKSMFKSNNTETDRPSILDAPSKYRFSVFVKRDNDIRLEYEDNRRQNCGYYIFSNYAPSLDKVNVYLKENKTGEILKIVKDSDSESAIGVQHPINGFLGFLQVEEVKYI